MRTKFYLQMAEVRENLEYLNVGVKIILNACSIYFWESLGWIYVAQDKDKWGTV